MQDLVKIQSGYRTRRKVMEDPFGSHRLLQARDIQENSINWQGAMRFTPKGDPKRYLIQPDNILFIARGYKNCAYLFNETPENLIASTSFYIIKVTSPKIVPGFLRWWMNQAQAQAYFAQFQVRSGFAYMSKTNLKELQVPMPPLATQRQIAELQHLREKEKALTQQINHKKAQFINAVCLSKILNEER